jgi:hypothetical protein
MNNTSREINCTLNEKEAAQYISNAAALWILGVGFAYFAHRASSPFMGGLCFWFSIFMLSDCWRQARVANWLDRNQNLLAKFSEDGITHYGAWLKAEVIPWKDIQAIRLIKGLQSEIYYFEAKRHSSQIFRYMLFGFPKFDLPVSALPQGKEGFLNSLSGWATANHLVPERAPVEQEIRKAA